MTDYVEGAMQDVKRDFCRAMAAGRGGARGKHGGDGKEAGAVYETHVAPVRRKNREEGSREREDKGKEARAGHVCVGGRGGTGVDGE